MTTSTDESGRRRSACPPEGERHAISQTIGAQSLTVTIPIGTVLGW
ncbi:MAG: hypothetical protein MZU84_04900 [Sphingobacterium sp.]|nr:hypothetical protein [Sphingobacterium sp.]